MFEPELKFTIMKTTIIAQVLVMNETTAYNAIRHMQKTCQEELICQV